MSFYMCTNGLIHPYNFTYLDHFEKKVRMEKTEIHSAPKKTPQHIPHQNEDFFAINIMTGDLISEPPESSVKIIKEKMRVLGAHHIPVVQNFRLMGMISDRDLLKIDQSSTFYFLKAVDVMTTVLVVCDEETPVEQIAKVLIEEKISCLPVIDKNQKISGIITRTDLLKFIIENQLVMTQK